MLESYMPGGKVEKANKCGFFSIQKMGQIRYEKFC